MVYRRYFCLIHMQENVNTEQNLISLGILEDLTKVKYTD
jgi:hypothetical protein